MSILDKMAQSQKEPVRGDSLLVEDGFAEEYPGLFELLTRVRFKGKPRKAGRITMYAEPGRATLCLVDADSQQVAFYTAEGFAEALTGAEGALQTGSLDWRVDKKATYRK
jgi:hypothetical protein